jgi:gluconolactonase
MLPTHLICSDDHRHHHLANIAFGGDDMRTLYITESMSGDILRARLPVAGKKLFAYA